MDSHKIPKKSTGWENSWTHTYGKTKTEMGTHQLGLLIDPQYYEDGRDLQRIWISGGETLNRAGPDMGCRATDKDDGEVRFMRFCSSVAGNFGRNFFRVTNPDHTQNLFSTFMVR